MNEDLAATIGAISRAAREQMGLTQAEVADRVGLVPPVYSRLERGQMLPSVPTLYRLCTELMLSPEDLLGLADSSAKGPRTHPEDDSNLRRLLFLARKLDERKLDALVRITTELAR
ncbi:helix-turn-helix domain-containing protein [Corallococcus sp. M34]|uniref:helix-turn-helix domain-containing protein n=1 Tax=Citreicoccus inhibens TaxID=2849499 RepID=UPI001C23BC98|nr:helix-turn-helix transcriptional regulator [Citreicoccus inhibens]MBU8900861.1 helix-turn-helix domain-containing protein [Citreicoccus inhibens]